jgi:hypothetical protein
MKLGTFQLTYPLDAEVPPRPVDLNELWLPDEVIEIDPDADAVPAPDES